MQTYRGALIELHGRLKDRKPFAFVRFGDGELRVLRGRRMVHREFRYEPTDPADGALARRLLDSFRYQDATYYVGIPCPKCVGDAEFSWAKHASGQPERQLTWATLFVNSNYTYFKEEVTPIFREYEVVIVCNRSAAIDALPFHVGRDFRIGNDAWRNDSAVADLIAEFIVHERVLGALFLFCAGPFSNILAQTLHARFKQNTYLDVGSTLDPFLFGAAGMTRRYLRGEQRFIREVCVWK